MAHTPFQPATPDFQPRARESFGREKLIAPLTATEMTITGRDHVRN